MSKPTGKLLFAYNTITALNERIAELEEKYEELRLRCVEALLVGDATNNAQKTIGVLEEQGNE